MKWLRVLSLCLCFVLQAEAALEEDSDWQRAAESYLEDFTLHNKQGKAKPLDLAQPSAHFFVLGFGKGDLVYGFNGFQIQRWASGGGVGISAAHGLTRAETLGIRAFYLLYYDRTGRKQFAPLSLQPRFLRTHEETEGILPPLDLVAFNIPAQAANALGTLNLFDPHKPRKTDTLSIRGYAFIPGTKQGRDFAQWKEVTCLTRAKVPRFSFPLGKQRLSFHPLPPGWSNQHETLHGLYMEGPDCKPDPSLSGSVIFEGNRPVGLLTAKWTVEHFRKQWTQLAGPLSQLFQKRGIECSKEALLAVKKFRCEGKTPTSFSVEKKVKETEKEQFLFATGISFQNIFHKVQFLNLLGKPGFHAVDEHPVGKKLDTKRLGVFQISMQQQKAAHTGTSFLLRHGGKKYFVSASPTWVIDEKFNQTISAMTAVQKIGLIAGEEKLKNVAEAGRKTVHSFFLAHRPDRDFKFNNANSKIRLAFYTHPMAYPVDDKSSFLGFATSRTKKDKDWADAVAPYYRQAAAPLFFSTGTTKEFTKFSALKLADGLPKEGEPIYILAYPKEVKHPVHEIGQVKFTRLQLDSPFQPYISEGFRLPAASIRHNTSNYVNAERIKASSNLGLFFTTGDTDYHCMGAPMLNQKGEAFGILLSAKYFQPAASLGLAYPDYLVGVSLKRYLETAKKIQTTK